MRNILTLQYGNIVQQLERELSKLKDKFQMAHELKIEWLPNSDNKKSGEVIGRTIYIYEKDEIKALDTLKHEFIDYIISTELEVPFK
jgi:predicted nuclease with TOPRIM domain